MEIKQTSDGSESIDTSLAPASEVDERSGDPNYAHIKFAEGVMDDQHASPKKLEEALIRLQRAIFLTPSGIRCVPIYCLRADIYLRVGDVKSAITDLRHAMQLEPRDRNLRAKLAFILDMRGTFWLQVRQFDLAVACFKEAAKLYTYYWPFRMHLALAYVCTGELDHALKAVESALENPLDKDLTAITLNGKELRRSSLPKADIYILRGKIYWAMGNVGLSVKDFRHAEQIDPQHEEVLGFVQTLRNNAADFFNLALKQIENGEYEAAVTGLGMSLEVMPDDMKCMVIRAGAYRRMGLYEDALNDLRAASLTYYEAMTGKPFEPADLLHPQYRGTPFREPYMITRQRNLVLNEIAVELAASQEYDQAITLLNKVIEEEMEMLAFEQETAGGKGRHVASDIDFRFLVNRGDCYRALDRIDLALADYHRACDLRPTDWEISTRLSLVHYTMGLRLYNEGSWEQAEDHMSTAIEYNPQVGHYYAVRGKIYYYKHEYGLAYLDFHEAFKLDPADQSIRQHLQQFRSSKEEFEKADLKILNAERAKAKEELLNKLNKKKEEIRGLTASAYSYRKQRASVVDNLVANPRFLGPSNNQSEELET